MITYGSAREFFEAARAASEDAARIRRQLAAMEHAATRPASPSLDPIGRGTTRGDRVAEAVARMVDREEELRHRAEEDYAIIDVASRILYGDGLSDGLEALMPPWVADAICLHFLDLIVWEQVAETLGYSSRRVLQMVRAGFELMDTNGMVATIAGRGMAET